MSQSLAIFNTLSTAEEYLQFFGLSYDPQIVNVNRLHILRKFSGLVREIDRDASLNDTERLAQYRVALQDAYVLFLTSSPLEQKLFKVFKQKPKNVVLLSDIVTE
ncbi:MAG: nitrogenase-stabilizing/protective protein NifW [Elainellaceae cyanobacterium]